MIKIENITKIYKIRDGSLTALNSVSFDVEDGEILGILGPNGAGKTTLLKIIAGLLIPESGNCTVNGFDIIENREDVRNSVNFLMSGGWIIFDYKLPVLFNLKFWSIIQGIYLKNADKKIDHVLKIVGLEEKKNEFPENLSSGMRQKMNLARCLLSDKQIYLLDEPTVGIDVNSANFLRKFIKKLREQGKTIILATHNLWEAEELCDRIVILNKGNVILVDERENIKKKFGKEIVIFKLNKITDKLIKNILKLSFVEKVLVEKNNLKIYCNVKRNLLKLVETCKKYSVIRDISIKEPSLNEIFTEIIKEDKNV